MRHTCNNAPDDSAVVVDTMVVSALVRPGPGAGGADAYRYLVAGRRIIVSFATVTELRYGAIKAGWGELRRRGLERDLAGFVIVQPDDEQMQVCASLRAQCDQSGHGPGQKVHEADRWIASLAIMLAIDLVSDDAIFRSVPGLTVLTPSA